jgi:hypothetical protein
VTDRVLLVPTNLLLANEGLFTDRIVRADRTMQDVERGLPGVLKSIDMRARNLGSLSASGADANVSLVLETSLGEFASAITAAWYEHFQTTIIPGSPATERVGIASEFGTIPTWRLAATVGWSRGPLSLFIAANGISSYDDANNGVRNGRTIDGEVLFDLQASLHLDAFVSPTSVLNDVRITAGVTNVLDTKQQYSSIADGQVGFDVSQAASLRQRFWYFRLMTEL